MFHFKQGTSPLLISIPHVGLEIPPDIEENLTDSARRRVDTDWHVDKLYDFAHGIGASVLSARYCRYVVDLNRPPDGASLYPGQRETSLCPTISFLGAPLYRKGAEPNNATVASRRKKYWQPYHDQLATTLAAIKAEYGYALLWDAHSIRSEIPGLFEGRLPDLNFGTADGRSCPGPVAEKLLQIANQSPPYSTVLNGRFKGGYITRHYGDPAERIYAVQLELAQLTYMNEDTFAWLPGRAAELQFVLRTLLSCYQESIA